ncbi:hypothetical protein MSG28_008451 [Choristoneura fumiferana]|uniref:Uncharacterized protein n=1 Tax=Choristoneura fumiferana TaxID=7141 RepID=A0ACC0J689_CHOFU|nr:hypothetical protein MSG28_008451 [Choristoneura fumiferana]
MIRALTSRRWSLRRDSGRTGVMADGVKRFSNGVRGPGDELAVGLQQDRATTMRKAQDRSEWRALGEAYVQQLTSFG